MLLRCEVLLQQDADVKCQHPEEDAISQHVADN